MPLIGGMMADKFGYGKMVTSGIIIMFVGYLLLAIPTDAASGKIMMFGSLALIACGTGLFKGNLQVMVGNLYDAPEYRSKRDQAFSLFYMAINIGAMYAPTAATKMTDWMLGKYNLFYESQIPALAHQFLNGTISAENKEALAALQSAQGFTGDMATFCSTYIEKLSEAYNYGFGVACISLIISMAIYMGFRSTFKHADVNTKQAQASHAPQEELSPAETKQRITALLLVFAVVLFFWMAFHQNGLTLTFFADEFTAKSSSGVESMMFTVWNLVAVIFIVYALFSLFQSKNGRTKLISGLVILAAVAFLVYRYTILPESTAVDAPIFQQFNPFYVVALTPVSMGIFGWLASKGKEPSAPRKIGLGMLVAACGYIVMIVASLGLLSPNEQKVALEAGTASFVSPDWLVSTYLVLTFGELLLSPMGISFVSKVAPPKYKGMMMGGWFVATAIGNYLTSVASALWGDLPLYVVWGVLVALCLLSALFIFSVMKRLEKVA